MNPNQAYAQYANNKILTASPAELTLMLYDGAIKFCNIAMIGIENKDIEKAHNYIRKAQLIVEEFQISLDRRYPVSKDFDEAYEIIMEYLKQANLKKDPDMLNEALKHLRTMRDAWKEVMRITANGTKIKVS